MLKLRLIAVALLAAGVAALFSLGARAEPLDREVCKGLQGQRDTLFTKEIKAALERGPDWVKDHLHSADEIEKVREFLLVEEKIKFRCRTDGVVMPDPDQVPLPDRKPPVPQHQIAQEEPEKVLAGAAATTILPLRKPSLSNPQAADADEAVEAGDAAGDVVDEEEEEEQGLAETAAGETTSSVEAEPGPSQTVADSDKTAPPKTKATQ